MRDKMGFIRHNIWMLRVGWSLMGKYFQTLTYISVLLLCFFVVAQHAYPGTYKTQEWTILGLWGVALGAGVAVIGRMVFAIVWAYGIQPILDMKVEYDAKIARMQERARQ